jgi:hypothetical protein
MNAAPDLPAVFQHWLPAQTAGMVSFQTGEESPAPLWRLDLPADAQQAAALLDASQAQLRATEDALEHALARLEALASGGTEMTSFAAGAPESAEQEVLLWLSAAQPGMISFGGPSLEMASEAAARLGETLRALPLQALHLAWVETRLEGALLARSAVDWIGDYQTAWSAESGAEQRAYHARSLALAVLSRLALLRMVAAAVQGAVKLSSLVAVPGGAIMALPAAWQFIQRLVGEAGRYQNAARALDAAAQIS